MKGIKMQIDTQNLTENFLKTHKDIVEKIPPFTDDEILAEQDILLKLETRVAELNNLIHLPDTKNKIDNEKIFSNIDTLSNVSNLIHQTDKQSLIRELKVIENAIENQRQKINSIKIQKCLEFFAQPEIIKIAEIFELEKHKAIKKLIESILTQIGFYNFLCNQGYVSFPDIWVVTQYEMNLITGGQGIRALPEYKDERNIFWKF
jgi:hypothetical protein